MINHTNQSAIEKLQTTLQRGHNFTFQLIRMQTCKSQALAARVGATLQAAKAVCKTRRLGRNFSRAQRPSREILTEIWAITNHIKFNKNKCQILDVGQGSPGYIYVQTGGCEAGEQFCRMGSGSSGLQQVESESTVCHGNPKSQLYPEVHQAQLS